MSILVRQSKPEMSRLVATLLQDVEGGNTFASALEKHPEFSRIYVQLVRAGEVGGVLDDVLNRLADNMEKQKEFRAKTKGAMIYPVIVIIAMVAVGFIMMIFVIPKLTEMYKDFGAELPLPTMILIGISDFMVKFWYIMIGGAVGGYVALNRWRKTPVGRTQWDRYVLKIPIFGILRQKVILTEVARTLSLLLEAGISLLQALEIVTEGVENQIIEMPSSKLLTKSKKVFL